MKIKELHNLLGQVGPMLKYKYQEVRQGNNTVGGIILKSSRLIWANEPLGKKEI